MPEDTKPGATNNEFPEITIVKYRPCEKVCLRAFLSVSIAPGILIHDCKLFEKDHQRWVRLPDREYTKKDGVKAYAPTVELTSRDLEPGFQRAVLLALDHYLQENGNVG